MIYLEKIHELAQRIFEEDLSLEDEEIVSEIDEISSMSEGFATPGEVLRVNVLKYD